MDWLTDKQFIAWKRRNALRRLAYEVMVAVATITLIMAGWYVLMIVFVDSIAA
jgi:hypothetical protein